MPPECRVWCARSPVLLLCACTACSSPPETAGKPSAADDSSPIETIADTADTDTPPEDTTESVPVDTDTTPTEPEETWPKPCDELYDPDLLPTFSLDYTPEEWAGVQSDCSSGNQQYRPVTFTYGDEVMAAHARLKGNWSWNCSKLQFVISFNEEDPDGRFHGQRKLMLDAPWYDMTVLHERLAFPFFEKRGLPYSCVNNARLVVNGEYYGLYANVERIDKEYLERHFENSDGNLYQGGTELKTNEDKPDTSDIEALNAARNVDEIAALVDLDQAVAEWASEAILPAMDNYWAGVEINYYLYHEPKLGFVYLPYDLDITFGDASYGGGNLVWPDAASSDPILYEHSGWRKEELMKRVLGNPVWCERFVEEVQLARAAYSPVEMRAQLEAFDAQIRADLEADPHRTFPIEEHDLAVAQLSTFLDTRAAFVDAWLAAGGHCPARW